MSWIDKVIDMMENDVVFNRHLGIRIPSMRHGFARMQLPFREEFVGDVHTRALHGGLISTIVDACGGAAAWSCIQEGDRISTLDLRVDYLDPAPPEDLVAEATVERESREVIRTDIRVFALSNPENIVATGRGVYKVRHQG